MTQQEERRNQLIEQIQKLQKEQTELHARLNVGSARIEKARAEGQNVESWEAFWIGLLRQYEALGQSIRDLQDQLHGPTRLD